MPHKTRKKRDLIEPAFTIIELVLVLAIAGLIFAMVFIGLPMLQRSQRNAQRRSDVDRVFSAVIEYQSNNHNRLPIRPGYFDINFVARYIDPACAFDSSNSSGYAAYKNCGEEFTDPDGTIYAVYPAVSNRRVGQNDYTAQATLAKVSLGTKPAWRSAEQLASLSATKQATPKQSFAGPVDAPITQQFASQVYDLNMERKQALNHIIYLLSGFRCAETEGKIYDTGLLRDFVVGIYLEGGGVYCRDDYDPIESTKNLGDERVQDLGPSTYMPLH